MSKITNVLGFGCKEASSKSIVPPFGSPVSSAIARDISPSLRTSSASAYTPGNCSTSPPGSMTLPSGGIVWQQLVPSAFHAGLPVPSASPPVRFREQAGSSLAQTALGNDIDRLLSTGRDSARGDPSSALLFRELVGINAGQTIPTVRSVSLSETAAFSIDQLRELDRRQDLMLKQMIGYCNDQIGEVWRNSFCEKINHLDVQLELLRDSVSSLSTSCEQKQQENESQIDACLKQCNEIIRIVDRRIDSMTNSEPRLQEMINNINSLSESFGMIQEMFNNINSLSAAFEKRLQDVEKDAGPSTRDSESTLTAYAYEGHSTSIDKEEFHALHEDIINNFKQVTMNLKQVTMEFEERFQKIDQRLNESENRFKTMLETSSTDKAYLHQLPRFTPPNGYLTLSRGHSS